MGRREKLVPANAPPTLGAALRRARHAKGLTLTALAKTLRYTKGHLSAVETGAVAPSRELIAAYESALGLPAGSLEDDVRPDRANRSPRPVPSSGAPAQSKRGAGDPTLGPAIDRALREVRDLVTESVRDARPAGDEITVTFQFQRSSPDGEADHHTVIQREVTRQAAAYAGNPAIADPARIVHLVRAVNPWPQSRVLDVATGPGYVARGFAVDCHEVVGIDFTPAPLAIAEQLRRDLGLTNVTFRLGDARVLGFGDAEFDAAVCRFTFHHLDDPAAVLAEMVRVCRPDGIIAVEDLIASEHPDIAAYQNAFERLRDPSHVRAWALSELLALFAAAGLEVTNILTSELTPLVETWLADAQTPPDRAAEIRALLERDAREDLSGTAPFCRDGALAFHQRTAIVVGRPLRRR